MDGNARTWAILLAVYATFALDVFSTFTSSPQTTEINAAARADTLMKWVKIGVVVAIGGGAVGSYASKSMLPLVSTVVVAGSMWWLYEHAKTAGLESGAPGTERYY
jgi:alcohol dehydrogenase class IV